MHTDSPLLCEIIIRVISENLCKLEKTCELEENTKLFGAKALFESVK